MTANGFSWPSATLVCSAVYISDALIEIGDEPKALNMDVHIGETGTRILKPSRSAGVLMGLVEVVVWRKPLSQMRSSACRLTLAICARM